ncbi:MAG: DUF2147 domain-containing protein [Oligosphaeraceae bacterium]|nr:DUF2147 domain-containing protein [Oligosphaeraceae bacterium]
MRKWTYCLILLALLSGPLAGATDLVEGFWKIIDDETGRQRSIIALYQHQGKLYGRLIITFDENEKVKNTIYAPQERAVKLPDQPYFAGLDIVWELVKDESKQRWHKGKILDPKKGKVYSSVIHWDAEKQHLVVRGKIGPFGRNQYWLRVQESEFPEGFAVPDTSTWVPKIPRT